MITRLGLIKLGYNKKQDRTIRRGLHLKIFRYGELSERGYLVNLNSEGIVNIEFGFKKGDGQR